MGVRTKPEKWKQFCDEQLLDLAVSHCGGAPRCVAALDRDSLEAVMECVERPGCVCVNRRGE